MEGTSCKTGDQWRTRQTLSPRDTSARFKLQLENGTKQRKETGRRDATVESNMEKENKELPQKNKNKTLATSSIGTVAL
ncbi:hypothetical protein chiPu_0002039 [Chiloscyllium punctatum]|uniref:Uncharacterized protein n=1 Tax=Chiloscyllium punctatum TaxID=137246 RepID=A0A401RZR0_CHIPU|nr:hypothetical protein [Chiloscyllium punctatum]